MVKAGAGKSDVQTPSPELTPERSRMIAQPKGWGAGDTTCIARQMLAHDQVLAWQQA
jgi:hypothetical protein